MEALGTLAGGVAHDLNNVLSGIVTYPDMLMMQLPKDSPLRRSIGIIQESGKKAAAIVQDLLTLARRGVVTEEIMNLNSIVLEYLESPEFSRMVKFHEGVDVETHLAPDLLNVQGSSLHLSKTIMNLITNAAEAMPDGGKIKIVSENLYVDSAIHGYEDVAEGDYIVITISDEGTGMSAEDKERIFEPFYTKKVMGKSGTGLGMAVVWGTVKDHNGYIDLESMVNEGTVIKLYLPATRALVLEASPILSREDYNGNGEMILVVDDIKEQRDITSAILTTLGYTPATAASGEEAVEYMKTNSADLIILDMIMNPGIDGLDTYKKIIEFKPKQKAIIASGFSETDRVREARKLGARKYIKKPYTIENIGVAIKAELAE